MELIYEKFELRSHWTLLLICKFLYILIIYMLYADFMAISTLEVRKCRRKCSCNVAVSENIVAVTGPKVAVGFAWSSCEGLPRSDNTRVVSYFNQLVTFSADDVLPFRRRLDTSTV